MDSFRKSNPGSLLLLCSFCVFALLLSSCSSKVIIKANKSDASIFVDDVLSGTGSTQPIAASAKQCRNIKIELDGFYTESFRYCGEKGVKTKEVSLQRDDAIAAATKTDYANNVLNQAVNKKLSSNAVWKIVSEAVERHFGTVEKNDKKEGHLVTSWEVQSFERATIRTRLTVKRLSGGAKYKILLQSQRAEAADVSVDRDDDFSLWTYVITSYDEGLNELRTRLLAK